MGRGWCTVREEWTCDLNPDVDPYLDPRNRATCYISGTSLDTLSLAILSCLPSPWLVSNSVRSCSHLFVGLTVPGKDSYAHDSDGYTPL